MNKAHCCTCLSQWPGKNNEEAISKNLVPDSDSELGSEASNFEKDFEVEEEEEDQQLQQQASTDIKTS